MKEILPVGNLSDNNTDQNFETLTLANESYETPSITSESFTENPEKSSKEKTNPWGIFVLGSCFVLMVLATYLFFYLNNDFTTFHEERLNSTWGYPFLLMAIGLLIFKASFFVYTLIRYFQYKSIPSVSDADLPTCTVIVP